MSTPALNDDKLYTTDEVADILNLSVRQVVRLRQTKRLGCVRISGASVRHSGAQVRRFVASSTEEAE